MKLISYYLCTSKFDYLRTFINLQVTTLLIIKALSNTLQDFFWINLLRLTFEISVNIKNEQWIGDWSRDKDLYHTIIYSVFWGLKTKRS